jgi:hypothetical protein
MSDGGFFGMLIVCALLVGGVIYLFKFQDSRPHYRGPDPRPTITFTTDPNAPTFQELQQRNRRW